MLTVILLCPNTAFWPHDEAVYVDVMLIVDFFFVYSHAKASFFLQVNAQVH